VVCVCVWCVIECVCVVFCVNDWFFCSVFMCLCVRLVCFCFVCVYVFVWFDCVQGVGMIFV